MSAHDVSTPNDVCDVKQNVMPYVTQFYGISICFRILSHVHFDDNVSQKWL